MAFQLLDHMDHMITWITRSHGRSAKIIGAILIILGVFSTCILVGLYQVRYHSAESFPGRRDHDPNWEFYFTIAFMNIITGILFMLVKLRGWLGIVIALSWVTINALAQLFGAGFVQFTHWSHISPFLSIDFKRKLF